MAIGFSNGDWVDDHQVQWLLSERFVRVGDSFFETILVEKGVALWLEYHYKRIVFSATVLQYSNILSEVLFKELIQHLISKNKVQSGKIRVICYRTGNGTYLSDSDEMGIAAFIENYENKQSQPISLCFYEDIKKPINRLSNLKSSNALLYVLASKFAKEKNFDDCILSNEKATICETSNSNLFIISNQKIYTPPLSDGCVAGVCRDVLISNFDIKENSISRYQLLAADAVFLSNTLRGIVPVKSIGDKEFDVRQIVNIAHEFTQLKAAYIAKQNAL